MKKIHIVVIITTLISSLLLFTPASAQGPSGNWESGVACQNQSSEPAAIDIYFYQEGTGVEILVGTEVIAGGKSLNIVTSALPSGSKGSIVIKSSAPITCAADHYKIATGTTANPYRFAASRGFDINEIGPKMYVSQVETKFYGWSSYISIQNTSGSNVDVEVTFVDRFGTSYPAATRSFNIPAYSNKILYLDDIPELPNRYIGGAVVSAMDGVTPLAVTVMFYNSGTSSTTSQIHGYNGAASGSNLLYVPYVVRNYYGYQSGIMIQNVGDQSTAFKITYTFNDRDYVYQHQTALNPGQVQDFYLPNVSVLRPIDGLSVARRFGKAVIEATDVNGNPNPAGLLIANINQDNRGGSGIPAERAGQGATYSAFLSTAGSEKAYIAKFMRNVSGFSSGFQVSNFSMSSGTCDIIFVDHPSANYSQNIGANSFFSVYGPNVSGLINGYNAGVIIDCDVEVFVITNAAVNPNAGRYGDSFYQMSAGTPTN
jgi:hypothetical protein